MNPMISVMSYELNHHRVECLYDTSEWLWFVIARGHSTCYGSFPEASEKMDEAIKELGGKMKSFRPCNQRTRFQSVKCPGVKTVCKACAECSLIEANYARARSEEGKRQDRLMKRARIQYDNP